MFTLSNTHDCAQLKCWKRSSKSWKTSTRCTREVNYTFARAIFLALKHFTYTHVCRRQHCASTSFRTRSRPSSTWLIHNYTTHSCSRHDLYRFKEPYTWSNIGHHSFNPMRQLHAMNGLSNLNIPYYSLIYVMKGLIPWLNHMYRMTYSYVWHDQFTCSTRHTHKCETRLINVVWHGPFNMLDETRAYMCDLTRSRV